MTGPLGLAGAADGQRVTTPAGAPPLAGVRGVGRPARVAGGCSSASTRRRPASPTSSPHPMGGQVYLTIRFYLYGDQAAAAAARAEPVWQAWLNERFPMPAEPAMAG